MSRKILEGSYEIVYISPESLFTGKHGERLSTHTHAFGTYYVINISRIALYQAREKA